MLRIAFYPTRPGPAAPRIVEAIAAWQPARPPRKRFHDLPAAASLAALLEAVP